MDQLSFIPLGGIGDVTKNMYIYEYKDQILLIDCGLGFADETMIGVDLLLPDITYLLQTKKRIVGMLLTHGHEDHIGALPFILPQLPQFPIYATAFTAALANEKLKEFRIGRKIQTVPFEKNQVQTGSFTASFIRVTHSVPDTAHIFLQTPVGNFYHGSDFKFDDTPFDGKVSDYAKIQQAGDSGALCLMSDCLGAERPGRTQTEKGMVEHFVKELRICNGKFIVTTYSSNIARLNQIIEAAEIAGRAVCFVGRSLLKTKDVAKRLGYLRIKPATEVQLDAIKNYPDQKLAFIVAGSQGQENSAMARIVGGEHKEVRLSKNDTVIFSADPIPGNEVLVYELVDSIAKLGTRVVYSAVSRDFHVSGHGSLEELEQLIRLVRPQKLIPIGGSFRHMYAYKNKASDLRYSLDNVLLLEDGQEVIFSKNAAKRGRTIPVRTVYVDEISGEEIESFVLRDRQKLSESGILIVLAEIDSNTGQLAEKPDIIMRGFLPKEEAYKLNAKVARDLAQSLSAKRGRVTNWVYVRKLIGEIVERAVFKEIRRHPLVLPVVIEV